MRGVSSSFGHRPHDLGQFCVTCWKRILCFIVHGAVMLMPLATYVGHQWGMLWMRGCHRRPRLRPWLHVTKQLLSSGNHVQPSSSSRQPSLSPNGVTLNGIPDECCSTQQTHSRQSAQRQHFVEMTSSSPEREKTPWRALDEGTRASIIFPPYRNRWLSLFNVKSEITFFLMVITTSVNLFNFKKFNLHHITYTYNVQKKIKKKKLIYNHLL